MSLYPNPPPPDTPRIRISMKIFARIRIRKKKSGSETLFEDRELVLWVIFSKMLVIVSGILVINFEHTRYLF